MINIINQLQALATGKPIYNIQILILVGSMFSSSTVPNMASQGGV